MWKCNNNQKVIVGPLKTLLINAAHIMIYDMVGFDLPQDMRNKKIIEEVIETLKEENEIIAELNTVFENLSSFEKIYAMHYVLTHFFNSKIKAPKLSLWMESTIDVLFNIIKSNIKVEIDEEDNIDEEEFKYRLRKLVVEAVKQYFGEKNIRIKNIEKLKKIDFWIEQIEILKEQILIDDDFNCIVNEGQYLPKMKIEKKTIVKMINDILKMK